VLTILSIRRLFAVFELQIHMAKANRFIKMSTAFWPSSIQSSDGQLHANFVAKLLVFLQKNSLRFSQAEQDKLCAACVWLIEGLYQSHFSIPNAPLILPLSKDAYGKLSRYNIPHSYRLVTKALNAAEELGFIDIVIGKYSAGKKGTLTRLLPAGRLLNHFSELGLKWRQLPTPNRLNGIYLNQSKGSADRRLANLDDAPNLSLMQDRLFKINEFLGKQCISINLPNVAFKASINSKWHVDDVDEDGLSIPQLQNSSKPSMSLQNVFLYRVFAQGSMSKGGRFYGAWWQQIPSKARRRILINLDKTVELDFSGLSCSMLYAREGLLPPVDPYDIGLGFNPNDPRRALVKKYMNAMLNDSSKRYKLEPNELAVLDLKHSELHARLCKLHSPIEKYFNSGIGVELQFHDSEMAEEVMLRLMQVGEVCLPIHDSFIVRMQCAELLWKTMQDVFTERFSQCPGIKPEFGYKGLSMEWPKKSLVRAKNLTLSEAFEAHINEYSLVREFYLSWERAHFSEEDIELRIRVLNDEHSRHKDLGLATYHRHKFFGLPVLADGRL